MNDSQLIVFVEGQNEKLIASSCMMAWLRGLALYFFILYIKDRKPLSS